VPARRSATFQSTVCYGCAMGVLGGYKGCAYKRRTQGLYIQSRTSAYKRRTQGLFIQARTSAYKRRTQGLYTSAYKRIQVRTSAYKCVQVRTSAYKRRTQGLSKQAAPGTRIKSWSTKICDDPTHPKQLQKLDLRAGPQRSAIAK